jgi:hypothetical protein
MNAPQLLEHLSNSGILIYVDENGKLRGRGPLTAKDREDVAGMREDLIRLLTEKSEPEKEWTLREALNDEGWSGELLELINWVWLAELPREPFILGSGQRIADPVAFYRGLLERINEGPNGSSALSGDLLIQLKSLKSFVSF